MLNIGPAETSEPGVRGRLPEPTLPVLVANGPSPANDLPCPSEPGSFGLVSVQFVQLPPEPRSRLHFGRAPAALYITQPALSRQIRQFEEELGVELIERSSRQVTLTPAGKRLAEDGAAAR